MEKREIYNIICKCCSKSFEIKVTPTKFKDGNHKIFCSLSCANSFNKSGNKHRPTKLRQSYPYLNLRFLASSLHYFLVYFKFVHKR